MNKKNSPEIMITSEPSYISGQSEPASQKFIFTYEIKIVNKSNEIVQLLNRYWRITDMTGAIEEILGAGVIGLQPLIKPMKSFSYTSYCRLLTPLGTMEGHFEMQNLHDERFTVEIPKLILSAPATITKVFRSILH